jgi:hypothetical protein
MLISTENFFQKILKHPQGVHFPPSPSIVPLPPTPPSNDFLTYILSKESNIQGRLMAALI